VELHLLPGLPSQLERDRAFGESRETISPIRRKGRVMAPLVSPRASRQARLDAEAEIEAGRLSGRCRHQR